MTETLADTSPGPLMELMGGFWVAKVLTAVHAVGLVPHLVEHPGRTAEELASALGLEHRPVRMLAAAGAALGLLEADRGRYRASELGRTRMVRGAAGYLGDWIDQLDQQSHPRWARASEVLRTGAQPGSWTAVDALVTAGVAELWETASLGTGRVLCVGPAAPAVATALCHHLGLSATAGAEPTDGFDHVLLTGFARDAGDSGQNVLEKCWASLPPGGAVLLVDLLLDDTTALMRLALLTEAPGPHRSAADCAALLEENGFQDVVSHRFAGGVGMIVGRKPGGVQAFTGRQAASTAEPVVELGTGLLASAALAAAADLDLFTWLDHAGGASGAEIADGLGLAEEPAEVLLACCVTLGLVTRDGERFALAPIAAQYLVDGRLQCFAGWVRMLDRRNYRGWLRLTEAVLRNRPTTWDPDRQASVFADIDEELLKTFWDGMYSLAVSSARVVAKTLDLSDVSSLLDVGGGGGGYAIELCLANPDLRVTVFDLPEVCDVTATKVEQAGLGDRVGTVPGDFFTDPELPGGYDCALLSSVLHDWGADDCRALLAKCFRALAPGGSVLIAELVADDDGSGPVPAALMSLNMLVETTDGANHTRSEYCSWLRDAGFTDIQIVPCEAPGTNGVIIARKP